MSRRQKPPSFNPPLAYRRAFERLEAALGASPEPDYSARIELLGRHLFGDLWRSGEPAEAPETTPQGPYGS